MGSDVQNSILPGKPLAMWEVPTGKIEFCTSEPLDRCRELHQNTATKHALQIGGRFLAGHRGRQFLQLRVVELASRLLGIRTNAGNVDQERALQSGGRPVTDRPPESSQTATAHFSGRSARRLPTRLAPSCAHRRSVSSKNSRAIRMATTAGVWWVRRTASRWDRLNCATSAPTRQNQPPQSGCVTGLGGSTARAHASTTDGVPQRSAAPHKRWFFGMPGKSLSSGYTSPFG